MLTVLLLTISGLTAQAPSLQWAMEFFPDQQSHFTEVLEHSSGGYVVSGWADGACLFKISPAGVIVWQWSLDSCQTQYAYWVSELPSGDLAVTGRCMQAGETNFAPFAARVTSSGETVWQSIFDINPERDECGLSVSVLPFGRLVICGYYDSFNMYNGYAYIRVVDASDGALIWQKAWGSSSATNFALRGLWSDGVIRILAHGTDGGTGAAHVLWYDDDGYYLGRRRISAFVSYYTGQGCPNGQGGFVFSGNSYYTKNSPQFALLGNVDGKGNLLWLDHVSEDALTDGISVSRTNEGGYLYGGFEQTSGQIGQPWWVGRDRGVIYGYDPFGEQLWKVQVNPGQCKRIEGLVETSSGQILACGGNWTTTSWLYMLEDGTAVREESGETGPLVLELSPNPFTTSVRVDCRLPSPAAEHSLSVYDLSGRLVTRLHDGSGPGESPSYVWSPARNLPGGCYLIRLECGGKVSDESSVLLR